MEKVKVTIVAAPEKNEEAETFVEEKLAEHAAAYIDSAAMEKTHQVAFHALHEEGHLIGAIYGFIHWRAMQVNTLWVDEAYRGRGYGRSLLIRAEQEARRLGCTHIFTETASFESPEFYLKAGYVVTGSVDNYPEGHSFHFLKKKLH